MAELVYDKNGRLLFTKEMKREYTLLFPTMLPVHFGLMARILETEGFRVEMLTTNHRGIVDEGLKYVHNDTCYPALLVIGQLIDAVKSGKYDLHKVALLITQTGGGCRASNYIPLLRKALEKADLSFIPVTSIPSASRTSCAVRVSSTSPAGVSSPKTTPSAPYSRARRISSAISATSSSV